MDALCRQTFCPSMFSTFAIAAATCASSSWRICALVIVKITANFVVIVNPGGTGRPMRVISGRFAPLPPSSGFMAPVPSARPSPK